MRSRSAVYRVWYRNFYFFRKTWLTSLVWITLEPLMYLGAIGFGLGNFVSTMDGKSFIDFYFPGLLASTSMMVPFFEGTYGNYAKLAYQRLYHSIQLAPISSREIVRGEVVWCATKGFLGVLGVVLVAFLLGLIHDFQILLSICVLLLSSFTFAALALYVMSLARNYDSFIYATSGFIIPMSLISGTVFPVEQMPFLLRIITYVLPLYHVVELTRGTISGSYSWMHFIHVAYLVVGFIIFMKMAEVRIEKKLLS